VPRLILFGGPGSGKGTQAEFLVNTLHIVHISTGDILRAERSRATDLGLKAQTFMDRGELVPDQIVVDMVAGRMAQPDADQGWLMDGFPRNATQSEVFEQMLKKIDQPYDYLLFLDVPPEILTARALNRRQQMLTESGQHRSDDTPETIAKRLKVYEEETLPMILNYQHHPKFIWIDGTQSMSAVTAEIKRSIGDGDGNS
jgi:adenylate kinase